MMAMNPSMLTPQGDVLPTLPTNWTAAPDLKSFVQQSELGGPAGGGAPALAPGTAPSADGAPSDGTTAAAGVDAAGAQQTGAASESPLQSPHLPCFACSSL
jgi:hypothetical protein